MRKKTEAAMLKPDEAHALIGMSGNVGATRMSQLARSVELACEQGDLEAARSALDPLGILNPGAAI